MTNRIPLYLMAVAFVVGAAAVDASACECHFPQGSIAELVGKGKGKSDAVFTGKAANLLRNQRGDLYAVEFEVLDVWKGRLSKRVRVATGGGPKDCGYPFEAGEIYLVYARNSIAYTVEKTLTANICTRTALLAEAKADIPHLGKRARPKN